MLLIIALALLMILSTVFGYLWIRSIAEQTNEVLSNLHKSVSEIRTIEQVREDIKQCHIELNHLQNELIILTYKQQHNDNSRSSCTKNPN